MTVAVKLTSTRRCMTCSFFVTFFMSLSRERSCCVRRGHCASVRSLRDSSAFPNALHSWSYFGSDSARAHSNFEFNGLESIMDVWRLHIATGGGGEQTRGARDSGQRARRRGERSRRVMWGWMDYGILIITAALTAGRYDHACASILLRILRRHLFIGNKKIEQCFFLMVTAHNERARISLVIKFV